MPSADTPGEYDWTVHTFEPSPRGITEATMRPGEIWHTRAPAATIRRLTNTATGDYACPRYTTDALGSIVLQRNYAPGTLAVTEATDEDGHIVREFRDMDGRTVMTAEGRGADMLRTRRVYDAYGRLPCSLPLWPTDRMQQATPPSTNSHFFTPTIPQDASYQPRHPAARRPIHAIRVPDV